MAILLDAVELPDLLIDNEFGWNGVQAVVEMSLGGRPIVWEGSATGKELDLVGGSDWGWISRSVLESLQALASVPLATYLLSYEGTEYTVRFRHEDNPTIEAEPIVPRPNAAGIDWFRNVTIRLMEV